MKSSSIIAGNGLTARTATRLIATLLHQTSLPRPIAITLDDGTMLDSADASIASLPREYREGTFTDALTFVVELKKGSQPTYRHKIMLVGHQAVGKTSLLHAMFPLCATFSCNDGPQAIVSIEGSRLVIRRGDVATSLDLTSARLVLEVQANRIALTSSSAPSVALQLVFGFMQQCDHAIQTVSIQPSSDESVVLDFSAAVLHFSAWRDAISRWKNNNAMESSIDTLHPIVEGAFVGPKSIVVSSLDLRVMDFAGQQGFVLCTHAALT